MFILEKIFGKGVPQERIEIKFNYIYIYELITPTLYYFFLYHLLSNNTITNSILYGAPFIIQCQPIDFKLQNHSSMLC